MTNVDVHWRLYLHEIWLQPPLTHSCYTKVTFGSGKNVLWSTISKVVFNSNSVSSIFCLQSILVKTSFNSQKYKFCWAMGFIYWLVAFMKIVINHIMCINLWYSHFLQLSNIKKLPHWPEVLEIANIRTGPLEKHNTTGKGLVSSGWIYISNNHPLETHLFVSLSTLIGLSSIRDSLAHIIVQIMCLICLG